MFLQYSVLCGCDTGYYTSISNFSSFTKDCENFTNYIRKKSGTDDRGTYKY